MQQSGSEPPRGVSERQNPFQQACSHLHGQWQGAAEDFGRRWEDFASSSGRVIQRLADMPAQAVERHAQQLQQRPLMPMLAVRPPPVPVATAPHLSAVTLHRPDHPIPRFLTYRMPHGQGEYAITVVMG